MVAYSAYVFGLLEPDERHGVFLHGFPPDQAVAIDVQARRSRSLPGAFIPNVEVVGHSTGEHVDGTLFHRIHVHNISASTGAPPRPFVTVAVISETLS
jgi:D-alanyl-D-alanine dipeptidase